MIESPFTLRQTCTSSIPLSTRLPHFTIVLNSRIASHPLAHRGAGAPHCTQATPARTFVVGDPVEESPPTSSLTRQPLTIKVYNDSAFRGRQTLRPQTSL